LEKGRKRWKSCLSPYSCYRRRVRNVIRTATTVVVERSGGGGYNQVTSTLVPTIHCRIVTKISNRNPAARLSRASIVALLVFFCGCDVLERPPLGPVQEDAPQQPTDLAAADPAKFEAVEPPGNPFEGAWEKWDAYFIRDQHVGNVHLTAGTPSSHSQNVVYQVDHWIKVRRGTATVIQRLSEVSSETADGSLIGFESRLHVGPAVTALRGDVDDGLLKVQRIRGGDPADEQLPWSTTCRGLVAVEQSLRRQPLTEGETRRLRMPMMLSAKYQMVTVRLQARGKASVPMLDGHSQTLLEIESQVQAGEQQIESVMWTDEDGNVLRTYSPAIQMFAYRVDEATDDELRTDGPAWSLAFDLSGRLDNPGEVTRVAYRISPSAAVAKAGGQIEIALAPGQLVRKMPDGSIQVLVSRLQETPSKGFVQSELEPTDEDRNPNQWIDSGAPLFRRIVDYALEDKGNASDREVALELTTTAKSTFDEQTQLFLGFRRASEIEDVGDSTDHAIVLTALLRARKIPARLVSGVVYVAGDQPRMVYHTWTLAYIDGSWLQLDATLGTIAPPDRIALGTTTLGEGTEYASIDAVTAAAGRIDIAIVGAQ
jgi:hypothetical protein